MRLPIQVQAIVFRRKEKSWEYLLLHRTPDRGNFWQPITGGLEEEDVSLEHCALRELEEEAGITQPHIIRIIPEVYQFQFNNGEGLILTEYVYGTEIKPDTPTTSHNNIDDEHDDMKWATYEEALAMLKWDDNKKALTKLKEILQ